MDIGDRIKNLVEEQTGRPLERKDELLGAGILDSMMTMLLVGRLEEEFGISCSAEDFTHHNFNSIEAMSSLVQAKINADAH